MKKFPQTLYVKIEEDGDHKFFVAYEELIDIVDPGVKTKVGIYALAEAGEAVGTVEFRKK